MKIKIYVVEGLFLRNVFITTGLLVLQIGARILPLNSSLQRLVLKAGKVPSQTSQPSYMFRGCVTLAHRLERGAGAWRRAGVGTQLQVALGPAVSGDQSLD